MKQEFQRGAIFMMPKLEQHNCFMEDLEELVDEQSDEVSGTTGLFNVSLNPYYTIYNKNHALVASWIEFYE